MIRGSYLVTMSASVMKLVVGALIPTVFLCNTVSDKKIKKTLKLKMPKLINSHLTKPPRLFLIR